jgi:hypothetical protein
MGMSTWDPLVAFLASYAYPNRWYDPEPDTDPAFQDQMITHRELDMPPEDESLMSLLAYPLHGIATWGLRLTQYLGVMNPPDYCTLWVLGLAILTTSIGLACIFWSMIFVMINGLDYLVEYPIGRLPMGFFIERRRFTWRYDIAYHWIPLVSLCVVMFALPAYIGKVGCHLLPMGICHSWILVGYAWMLVSVIVVSAMLLGALLILHISDRLGVWVGGVAE